MICKACKTEHDPMVSCSMAKRLRERNGVDSPSPQNGAPPVTKTVTPVTQTVTNKPDVDTERSQAVTEFVTRAELDAVRAEVDSLRRLVMAMQPQSDAQRSAAYRAKRAGKAAAMVGDGK